MKEKIKILALLTILTVSVFSINPPHLKRAKLAKPLSEFPLNLNGWIAQPLAPKKINPDALPGSFCAIYKKEGKEFIILIQLYDYSLNIKNPFDKPIHIPPQCYEGAGAKIIERGQKILKFKKGKVKINYIVSLLNEESKKVLSLWWIQPIELSYLNPVKRKIKILTEKLKKRQLYEFLITVYCPLNKDDIPDKRVKELAKLLVPVIERFSD